MSPTGVTWRSSSVSRAARMSSTTNPTVSAAPRVLGTRQFEEPLGQLAVEVEPGRSRSVRRLLDAQHVWIEAPLALEVVTRRCQSESANRGAASPLLRASPGSCVSATGARWAVAEGGHRPTGDGGDDEAGGMRDGERHASHPTEDRLSGTNATTGRKRPLPALPPPPTSSLLGRGGSVALRERARRLLRRGESRAVLNFIWRCARLRMNEGGSAASRPRRSTRRRPSRQSPRSSPSSMSSLHQSRARRHSAPRRRPRSDRACGRPASPDGTGGARLASSTPSHPADNVGAVAVPLLGTTDRESRRRPGLSPPSTTGQAMAADSCSNWPGALHPHHRSAADPPERPDDVSTLGPTSPSERQPRGGAIGFQVRPSHSSTDPPAPPTRTRPASARQTPTNASPVGAGTRRAATATAASTTPSSPTAHISPPASAPSSSAAPATSRSGHHRFPSAHQHAPGRADAVRPGRRRRRIEVARRGRSERRDQLARNLPIAVQTRTRVQRSATRAA